MLGDLRERLGRLSGRVLLALLALLVIQNVWCLIRNQRNLRAIERFQHSSRDIEHLARVHNRYPVSQWLAVFYLLEHRIRGKHLTIPPIIARAEWELEKVARLDVDVAEETVTITDEQAQTLHGEAHDKRIFQIGSRRRPWRVRLYFVPDPAASSFSMVKHDSELFVLSDEELARLTAAGPSP